MSTHLKLALLPPAVLVPNSRYLRTHMTEFHLLFLQLGHSRGFSIFICRTPHLAGLNVSLWVLDRNTLSAPRTEALSISLRVGSRRNAPIQVLGGCLGSDCSKPHGCLACQTLLAQGSSKLQSTTSHIPVSCRTSGLSLPCPPFLRAYLHNLSTSERLYF